MRQAIVYYERAVARDPQYALAYAGIALAHTEMVVTGDAENPEQAYARAEEAVQKALSIDGGLAEAHCVLAQIRMGRDFDWVGAEAGFRRALELSPGYSDTYDLFARMLAGLDRYDEAIALVRRAHELDPFAHRADIATTLLRAGRLDEALESARQGVELDPDYDRGRATLGWACMIAGRTAEGLAELERAVALSPGNTTWLAQLGEAYAMVGRTDEARDILRQLEGMSRERHVSPYHLAYVHTGLGSHDAAIEYLERAYEQRSGAISSVKGSFLFAPLRGHPRFVALLKKMNLAP